MTEYWKDNWKRYNGPRYERGKMLIESLKEPCVVCGESERCCIDFHHRDPSTKYKEISQMRHFNEEKIRAEVSKCVTLCANCHRKVHAGLIELGISTY